ncbi:glycine cleavage system protein R [Gemmatimonadota bacterium]
MSDYVLLSGVGPDKPGIARAISGAAFCAGCSIEDSRMAVLGGEFAILVLIGGSRDELAKLSATLPELEKETGLTLNVRPTAARGENKVKSGLPYGLSVVGMDRTGIVFRVTELLARFDVNIDNLETEAGNAPVTGTPIFRMNLEAEIPGDVPVRKLRGELADLCDELNMDFTLEALS